MKRRSVTAAVAVCLLAIGCRSPLPVSCTPFNPRCLTDAAPIDTLSILATDGLESVSPSALADLERQAAASGDRRWAISTRIGKNGVRRRLSAAWSPGRFRSAFLAESDPGERWHWSGSDRAYGFDHWTGFVDAPVRPGLRVIGGTFRPRFGLGLVLSVPRIGSIVRGPFTLARTSARSVPWAITGYAGSDEDHFLSGAAASVRFGSLDVLAYASVRRLDAAVEPSSGLAALRTGGDHATGSGHASRGRLPAVERGLVLGWSSAYASVGILHRRDRYRLPTVLPARIPGRPRQRSDASSVFARFGTASLAGSIEAARIDADLGVAAFLLLRSGTTQFLLSARRYGPGFTSRVGTPPSGASGAYDNERGFSIALHQAVEAGRSVDGAYDSMCQPHGSSSIPFGSCRQAVSLHSVSERDGRRWRLGVSADETRSAGRVQARRGTLSAMFRRRYASGSWARISAVVQATARDASVTRSVAIAGSVLIQRPHWGFVAGVADHLIRERTLVTYETLLIEASGMRTLAGDGLSSFAGFFVVVRGWTAQVTLRHVARRDVGEVGVVETILTIAYR